VPHTPRLVE